MHAGLRDGGRAHALPHPSQLYRTLLSKDWQPALCLAPQFCVPPTTIVNRAHVARDPRSAARGALAALAAIRATRDATKEKKKKGGPPAPKAEPLPGLESAIPRGVVKLGFAWEAAHVVMWRGETQLATALERLSTQAGCEEVVLLVQDFVPNSLEARAYVVNGQIVHTVFTTFGETDADGYQVDFARKEREAALGAWLDGDEAAMAHLERRMPSCRRWLAWLRCRRRRPSPRSASTSSSSAARPARSTSTRSSSPRPASRCSAGATGRRGLRRARRGVLRGRGRQVQGRRRRCDQAPPHVDVRFFTLLNASSPG